MGFFEFIMNLEHNLPLLIQEYDVWIYALLFLIIYAETAFVFMFFLPGDSLLLVVGALCATTAVMHLDYIILILFFAASLGYFTNYYIGSRLSGQTINPNSRWIKKDYLIKTQDFFQKHGGKTILLARFIPFARSFAAFAAGYSRMNIGLFTLYNLLGAILWIGVVVGAGYLFSSTIIMAME